MGADLYRQPLFAQRYDRYQADFHAACARLQRFRTEHPDRAVPAAISNPSSPPSADRELAEIERDIDRYWDAIYAPDAYFRDSYNESSLFWRLGLSWWSYTLGDDSELRGSELQPLYDDLRARAELLSFNIAQLPLDSGPDGELDQTYFLRKYDQLLAFLKGAIDADDTVIFSV